MRTGSRDCRERDVSVSDPRRGVSPTILQVGSGANLVDRVAAALEQKGASVTRADVEDAVSRGDIGFVDADRVAIHRPVPDEVDIDLPVLARTDRYVVIDKPAGIATTPKGSYVARSVLVQARRQFGDDVVCAHRLDRATTGVLLLITAPHYRGAYQSLFEHRLVHKTYEFIAKTRETIPSSYSSRLSGQRGRTREVEGEANATTRFRLLETRGELSRYEACPLTGQRHQIRAHASALGIPILGDCLYGPGAGYPDRIALLARNLSFLDPVDGSAVTVSTVQTLSFP